MPKGARLVINVHYHPTRSAEEDTTAVDLRWTANKPQFEARLALVGNFAQRSTTGEGLQPGPSDPASGPRFEIPAGATNHTETMKFTIPREVLIPLRLFTVGTHMHYVGTDMKIEIDRSSRLGGAPADEPRNECLLGTPAWDFNWQRSYLYDVPLDKLPTVRGGDVVTLRCTYDNSLGNRFVARALDEQGLSQPRAVTLGEQTLDEMCLGAFGFAVPTF